MFKNKKKEKGRTLCILRLKRDSDSERKGTVIPSEKGQ